MMEEVHPNSTIQRQQHDSSWCCSSSFILFTLFFAVVFFIAPLEISNVILWDDEVWIQIYGIDGMYNSGWCEAIESDPTRFIIEPVNARSAYVYVIFGCSLIVLGVLDLFALAKDEVEEERSAAVPSSTTPFFSEENAPTRRTQEADPNEDDEDDSLEHQDVLRAEDGRASSGLSYRNDRSSSSESLVSLDEEQCEQSRTSTSWVKVRNAVLQYPHITITNGLFNILHGLGSFWYHACQCPGGGTADAAGMLAVISFPLWLLPLQIVWKKSTWWTHLLSLLPVIGQSLLWILCWFVRIRLNFFVTFVVSLLIGLVPLTILYFYCWVNKSSEYGIRHTLKLPIYPMAVALFLSGYGCWVLDKNKTWCFKDFPLSLLQGHAFWHFLTCGALLLSYMLFRTEEIMEERPIEGRDTGVAE
mmetsp:Transcript_9998/g.14957  ORF Transcript_9998/g.14957 Transcript_9998/m.14957 type:complete len:416 (-) Transcript_9998:3609-4856(-)